VVKAPQRREAVAYLRSHYGVSERRACLVVGQPRSVQWYQSRRPPQDALKRRIKELAEVRVRYGYKRIHVLLRREGWPINHML
jgi:putative transposase